MGDVKQSVTTIEVREDGTINVVCVWQVLTVLPEGVEKPRLRGIVVDNHEELEALKGDPDLLIYKDGKVRSRTDAESRTRVREIWDRVRTGELQRCKNDLIERHSRYFTADELAEVELPRDAIKRLTQENRELKKALGGGN